MILCSAPPSIEVVNQAECRLIEDITYVFPSQDRRYGSGDFFLDAKPEDLDRADAVSEASLTLSGLMTQARRQSNVMGPGGWQRSGTLDAFESCIIRNVTGDRQLAVLSEATLLIAVQDIPAHTLGDTIQSDEWDWGPNRSQYIIGSARLLGAILVDAGLVTQDMGSLAERFIDRYNDADGVFKKSASVEARALLQAVRVEYLNAVRGGPMEDLNYTGSFAAAEETIKNYRDQNQFIVQLASLPSSTTT